MNKRSFIKNLALTGIGTPIGLDAMAALFNTKKNKAQFD
jgi:hypothetical protein